MTIEERINELGEKYEKQKEINKELVDENEALKFAARMSEKTELQLREKNKDLADCNSRLLSQAAAATKRVVALEKENAELKEYNKYLRRKRQGGIQKQYNKVAIIKQQAEQLTKAKELLKKMYYLYHDPCVTNKDLENRDKLFEEVKQFIKE